MKKIILSICALFFVSILSAQGITTASAYFKTISEYYASFKDYEVDFEITIDKKETAGVLSYKAPDLLRLDYSNPKDQVICFNGDLLTVYLPESSAVLMQQVSVENSAAASLASGATGQGLSLMSRYYTVAYESGQNAEPLDEGSDEMVVKFILTKKTNAEAFRYIKVCVNEETKLIRRVEAVTPKGETFIFNFYDYKIDEGISEQRFIYDAPSSANNYNNFLYAE
ncbi:MAG: outer-membrane lipoprotein carrier protein LolA [Treponema sp.]|nr:outer-membrane lipoprotein carrier protein LolA [Treponema sp.]